MRGTAMPLHVPRDIGDTFYPAAVAIKRRKDELRDAGVTESVIFPDLDGLGRELEQWCKVCPSLKEKRVTVHRLRHTMAMDLLQCGCSFCRVQLKQACIGSGQCHPNSMPFSQQHGRGIH